MGGAQGCSKSSLRYPMRSFFQSKSAFHWNHAFEQAWSCPSGPQIACMTSAQSSAERQIGPSLSIVQLKVMAPVRGTKPKVGRKPVTPQRVEGPEMEPPVSDPIEKATEPADVADAGPADEPLDPCAVFQGLRVWPPNHLSPMASAPSVSLATSTAPAESSR